MAIPVIVHKVVLYSSAVVSVLGNGLLLVLLLHKNSNVLGKYRLLLATFALADIAISLFDSWFIPMFLLCEYGYIYFGFGSLHLAPRWGTIANVTYCTTFFLPFVLLSLHFVYRYLSLARPTILQQKFWLFILMSSIYSASYIASIAFIAYTLAEQKRSASFLHPLLEYANSSEIPTLNAIPVEYIDENRRLRTVTVVGVLASGVLGGKSIIICVVCIFKIVKSIKNRVLEIRARRLQIQLFRALIIQFIVPFVFSFVPFAVIVGSPAAGVSFGQLGNICAMVTSLFPAIDPLLITISISRFRGTLLEWFYRVTGRTAERNEKKAKEMSRAYTSMMGPKGTVTF